MSPLNTDPRCAFTTHRGLLALLARYRALYTQGLSDVEITARIRGVR